jgi:CBS domain-containing protein
VEPRPAGVREEGEIVIHVVSREIDPRRIRIQLEGNILTLSGATNDRHPDHAGYHAFTRKVVLPATVDEEHISARARGTLLTVRLGKRRKSSNAPALQRPGFPLKVKDIMTRDVLSVAPETPVRDAAELLGSFNIGSVPVCQDRKAVGVLTDRDIAVRVTARSLDPAQVKVQEVMTRNPVTCDPEDDLVDVEEVMADAQVRRLPVVDRDGNMIGYLAMAKIARSEHDLRAGHLLRGVSEPG